MGEKILTNSIIIILEYDGDDDDAQRYAVEFGD